MFRRNSADTTTVRNSPNSRSHIVVELTDAVLISIQLIPWDNVTLDAREHARAPEIRLGIALHKVFQFETILN